MIIIHMTDQSVPEQELRFIKLEQSKAIKGKGLTAIQRSYILAHNLMNTNNISCLCMCMDHMRGENSPRPGHTRLAT